ncbi:MAG TPA: YceD family protein [Kineosporiaceae bacterium]|nr:YceD family protein [Kineosporiaceae bacterium]
MLERSPELRYKECTIRLDHRSPYVLDTRDLGRRPGTMRKVARTVPASGDMGTEIISIPEGTEIELKLRLEAVMEGVLVSGTASGVAVGECIRCLDEVRLPLEISFTELFSYPENRVAEDEDQDVYLVEEDLINLEPVLRDAVVLALPFQPVCREDCPGLCSECGVHLADDPAHTHENADPRWSALQGILADGVPGPAAADSGRDDEKEK